MIPKNITTISAVLLDSIYLMNLVILSYIPRPSFMECTMVVKLSSSKIISAVSFVTSEPDPIAIPTSAPLSAGASLTPSPVIDTISP